MKNIDHKFTTTTTNQLSFSSLYSGSGTNIRHVDTFDDPEVFPFRIPCPFYHSRTTYLTDDDDVGLF